MALAAIGLFLIGYQWGNQLQFGNARPLTLSGVMLRPPQPLPDFVLADSNGGSFGRPQLLDRWSLVALAPLSSAGGHLALNRMVEVYNRLAGDSALQRKLALLLVTGDDAPGLARDFERLSPAIRVLTGDPEQREVLRGALGAGADDPSDNVPPLFLIGPRARLLALFPSAQPAQAVADDVASLAAWPGLEEDAEDE